MLVFMLMGKKRQKTTMFPKKGTLLGISITVVIVGAIGYFAIISMTPVNADFPMFAAPTNIYIKTISTPDGSVFTSLSTRGSKNPSSPSGSYYPTLTVQKGNLVSLHFINEDSGVVNYNPQHDLNIDEFNVHSNVLGKFQAQTITFVADKQGTFDYYCSIHPEMQGKIVVE